MPSGHRPAWPDGVARVAISGLTQGHRWAQVFYAKLTHTNPVTVNDLKTVADAVALNHYINGAGQISSTTTLTAVDVSFIPSAGNVLDYTGTYAYAGAGGTAAADAGASVLLVWTISARYRGGHPRSYTPGIIAANVTNGSIINASALSTLVTNANTWRNTLNALTSTNITGVSVGTVRYANANAWLVPPVFYPWTSVKGNSTLCTQRRRIRS